MSGRSLVIASRFNSKEVWVRHVCSPSLAAWVGSAQPGRACNSRDSAASRQVRWQSVGPRLPSAVSRASIRWEPVAELSTIQNEMNRPFNNFFEQPAQGTRSQGTTRRWLPAMDLIETADHYLLRADLPGLSDGDVNFSSRTTS